VKTSQHSGALHKLRAASKRTLRQAANAWWEFALRIRTRGIVPIEHADSVHYATLSYSTIFRILDHLALQQSDVFVDIGCGKGRVLCCAARYPIGQVIGVELSEPLCDVARRNAQRLRRRRTLITVHHSPATDFDYSSATVLFLFDPFGAATLGALLEKIGRDPPKGLRIAYANPTHDAVFEAQAWLDRSGYLDAATSGMEHSISFYSSRRK
jgi:precorrin-6B methylase 2